MIIAAAVFEFIFIFECGVNVRQELNMNNQTHIVDIVRDKKGKPIEAIAKPTASQAIIDAAFYCKRFKICPEMKMVRKRPPKGSCRGKP